MKVEVSGAVEAHVFNPSTWEAEIYAWKNASRKRTCQRLLASQVRQSLSLAPGLSHIGVIHRKRFRGVRTGNT